MKEFLDVGFNPVNEKTVTADYTITLSDSQINVSGTTTLTLPTIADITGKGSVGYKIRCVDTDGNVATLTGEETVNDSSSVTLSSYGEELLVEADFVAKNWKITYPVPYNKIKGSALTLKKTYGAITVDTNGTTAVNVFASAPTGLKITNFVVTSQDSTAGDISLKEGSNTISTVTKSTTAGTMTGEDGSLSNENITAGTAVTVVSSTAGNARCLICFEAAL